jgi:ABC-2 type transport system permease protein
MTTRGMGATTPAPAVAATRALLAHELRLTARRGENVLVTLVIPVAVLLFFARAGTIPASAGDPVAALVPGVLALAIIAAGLVNLGIATAYERSYGVLKRLGGAPIERWVVVVAKVFAVLVVEVIQAALLLAVAVVGLGWEPGPGWSPVVTVLALALGTLTFTSLGLLLAGTLRAEATLAIANGLFLGFLMLGGLVLPISELPGALQPIARGLPATALVDLLRFGLDSGVGAAASDGPLWPLAALAIWGGLASILATRRLRWD